MERDSVGALGVMRGHALGGRPGSQTAFEEIWMRWSDRSAGAGN